MRRCIVITGGAKGIGYAVASAFTARNDRVVLLDQEAPEIPHPDQHFIACDVTNPEALDHAISSISQLFPRVDVLINNAGFYQPLSIAEISLADWQHALQANLTPAFLVSKAMLPLLATGATIVNVSSSLGNIPEPEAIAYSVAKAGVNMLTRCLALALAPCGVRVVAVAPGPIQSGAITTDEICQITGENLATLNPLGRFGTVDEVAALIVFLASRDAAFMTGSIISQNGGEDSLQAGWSTLRALRETGKVNRANELVELQALAPSERVRVSAEQTFSKANHITLNEKALLEFLDRYSFAEIRNLYCWDRDFHPTGTRQQMIEYVFTIDAVNFGSGYSPEWKARRPYSTYQTIATVLTRAQNAGTRLNAEFAAAATPALVATLLEEAEEFPLVSMFAQSWNSLGVFVLEQYGSFEALLDTLPQGAAAQALIDLLVTNLPEFNDQSLFDDGVAFFYKRAQILVNDLHLALAADSPFQTAEIARLTMFADNLVAHVLQTEGVLMYSDELMTAIKSDQTLPVGSTPEIEIRAAEIVAVEKATRLLQTRGMQDAFPAMIDVFLWTIGQAEKYKVEPRHRTKGFFY